MLQDISLGVLLVKQDLRRERVLDKLRILLLPSQQVPAMLIFWDTAEMTEPGLLSQKRKKVRELCRAGIASPRSQSKGSCPLRLGVLMQTYCNRDIMAQKCSKESLRVKRLMRVPGDASTGMYAIET